MNYTYWSVLLLSIFLASCGSAGDAEGPAGEIEIDGSSTVFPITEAIAEEFRAKAPNVRVTVGLSGTGGAFQKFLHEDIGIVNASPKIKPEEATKAADQGEEYVRLSVAYDGLSVVVHPRNDWVQQVRVANREIWGPAAQGEPPH